ncbi:Pr6Pr family membrane protein [Mesoplasma corruscae]|uniref:Pr6Pr family membrane protein n=1 Tax=Mesoplasma corruscae TaxID=216874 RepID=A0A2S5RG55_9MOLU|nr:Pr6Pr family membrane protein [Mesoplasma corruscae]PPE06281.1 hypothetical protein MCORR_v1c05860 [Mesoplasma corruscae]
MTKFKISYKLFFGLLSFTVMIAYYVWGIFNNNDIIDVYNGNYETFTIDYFTTFTLLSNVLVHAWLIAAGINYKQEGKSKLLGHTTANTLATLITLTFIIYNFVLIPVQGFPTQTFSWITSIINHVITPIIFVIYVNFMMENKEIVIKKEYILKKFWIPFTMTLAYCLFAMFRGELRLKSGYTESILYPYFFLNVHKVGPMGIPGYGWFAIAFVLVVVILFSFSFLYNCINNKMVTRKFIKTSTF